MVIKNTEIMKVGVSGHYGSALTSMASSNSLNEFEFTKRRYLPMHLRGELCHPSRQIEQGHII